MTQHDDNVRLGHMLEYAREACALTQGRTRADLLADRVLELALTRLLEVVGEAANCVSEPTQARHPQIPWRNIIGLRNRLIDGYEAVDDDIMWEIIEHDLPPLISALTKIFEER